MNDSSEGAADQQGWPIGTSDDEGGLMSHHFNPEHRHHLLSAERYERMPPGQILGWLPLRPDMTIADIGCGPGFFTLPLAERLPQGTVLALDVEPVMLQTVEERAVASGLTNIRTLLAGEAALPIEPDSLDGAFLSMVYHELPTRQHYLEHLQSLVKPGGWLAIAEWEKMPNPGGGPPLENRLTPAETSADMLAAGWPVTARETINEWMYFLLSQPGQ
jgi:ubiquinone/menaquinone biosynthesis C-methylase UbiE